MGGGIGPAKHRCPKCGNQFTEESDKAFYIKFFGSIILSSILLMWFMWTMFDWLLGYEHKTLVQVLMEQWKWLSEIRIW